MHTKRMTVCMSVAVLAIMTAGVAQAVIVETDSNSGAGPETAFDSTILNNDLINTGQPSLASASQDKPTLTNGSTNGGSVADSHDGSTTPSLVFGGNGGLEWLDSGTTITYQFNLNPGTGGSASGYTITGVHFIDGWSTPTTFADQKWDLQITTLTNPTFATVWSVDYQPSTFQATLVSLAGDIGSGVTGIQFVTSLPGGSVVREIDVLGFASPVPEPSTVLLLAVGALLLVRRRFGGARA